MTTKKTKKPAKKKAAVKKTVKKKPASGGIIEVKAIQDNIEAGEPVVLVEEKNPEGRPSDFTEELGNTICKRLSDGESLNAICKEADFPSRVTVYNWLADDRREGFLNKYTDARERQAETFIDQCTDIADDTEADTIIIEGKDGPYEKVNFEHINRSRLRVDTRIKLAEKLFPRKYTPRKALEHSGEVGIKNLDDNQLDKRIKALEDKFK